VRAGRRDGPDAVARACNFFEAKRGDGSEALQELVPVDVSRGVLSQEELDRAGHSSKRVIAELREAFAQSSHLVIEGSQCH